MALGAPTSVFVEVELTAGVWTNVTDWVDWSAGVSTQMGRTSPYSPPQAGNLSLTLDNTDGRFTPLRQTLKDLTTPHPYWPNLLPRKRIRFGYYDVATQCVIHTGMVKGWPPGFKDGIRERVVITSTDRSTQLAGVNMDPPIQHEIAADAPAYYWPLTESSDTVQALEASNRAPLSRTHVLVGDADTLTFGESGPGSGDGTGLRSAPTSNFSGEYLYSSKLLFTVTAFTIEAWINPGKVAQTQMAPFWLRSGSDSQVAVVFNTIPGGQLGVAVQNAAGASATAIGNGAVFDGNYHHVAITQTAPGALTLYLDGVAIATGAGAPISSTFRLINVAAGDAGIWTGLIGQVAIYNYAMSAARIGVHVQAGRSFLNETVDQRVARFLSYAGMTAADWSLDASNVKLSSYPQAGQNVLAGSQDLAGDTEAGGAVFYIDRNGKGRFVDRDYPIGKAPAVTLDAAGDLDGDTWAPAFDADSLVNSSTGTRVTASGPASTRFASSPASIAAYQLSSGDFSSYAASDDDVLYNAQQRVASGATPGYRLSQITIDLYTAQTAGLYAAIAALGINDRIRITNLPAGAAPRSTIDLLVQGISHDATDSSYRVTLDTSPADNPAGAEYEDAVYGRYQSDGQVLNAALTPTSTTVVIASPTLPTFTTAPGQYPMSIRLGAEELQLTSPPSDASTPQTFTGVTRGINGTTPAAQSSGSPVTLSPLSSYNL